MPGVHRPHNRQVRVRIESLVEPLALVVEVAANIKSSPDQPATVIVVPPGVLTIPVWIAPKALLEQRSRLVAQHPNLACKRQTLTRGPLRKVVTSIPVRVV